MEHIIPFIPFIVICVIGYIPHIFAIARRKKAERDAWLGEYEQRRKRRVEEATKYLREQETERRKREEQRAAEEHRRRQSENISARQLKAAEQRRLMKASLRYEILTRDGFRCKICGASAEDGIKLHVDHIIPVSKGGLTEKSNLRTLCERCNLGKGDKIESISMHAPPSQPVVLPRPVTAEPEKVFAEIQNLSMNEAVQMLNAFGIRYVDHTDRGGCFWIELTEASEILLHDKTIDGRKIHTAKRSKAFSNAPAFYIK